MKQELQNEITKELDNIYGIEGYKEEILNYIKYLEIKRDNDFANCNIMINSDSEYTTETIERLIDFICKALNKNKIIKTGYEYLSFIQIRNYRKNNKKFKNENEEVFKINSDLVIIDVDKIGKEIEEYKYEIVNMINEFKEKVFIISSVRSYRSNKMIANFNKYFDWYFEIGKISTENKKDFVLDLLNKNNINIEENCCFLDNLIQQPFYIVKSKIINILFVCKLNNITSITDKVVEEYFKPLIEEKKIKKECKEEKKEILNFKDITGLEDVKNEIRKIVNYVTVCKKRNNKMPSLHMCFTGNPRNR